MLAGKFRSADGPFFRSLEKALTVLHVELQAYHGGTFVGSHVNKLVKVLKFTYIKYAYTYQCSVNPSGTIH